ncbi:MAG: hypothetical protein LBK67_09850 [Coriobacteriales bacterium]|nr:hypothetical protein [Coriobacteriales bacterium]
MSNYRNSQKKVYNEELPFKITGRGWDTGDCVLLTIEGCEGFMLKPHKPSQMCTSLETNFFFIELLKVSLDDSEALAQFMGQYGLLDCPYREGSIPLSLAHTILPSAVRKTNRVRKHLQKDHMKKRTLAELDGWRGFSSAEFEFFIGPPPCFVSRDEAAAVLRLLQDTVRGLFFCLDSKDLEDSRLFEFVNMNVSSNNQIVCTKRKDTLINKGKVLTEALHIGSLTCAISNQIIEAVADDAAWYRCEADKCGHWFKRKRGTDAARTNSKYCSKTCLERMRKRNKRKSKTTDPST